MAAAPEQQRRILFNAYLEYSRRVAQKSAIVVLLDDLHWADEPRLQLRSMRSYLFRHNSARDRVRIAPLERAEMRVDQRLAAAVHDQVGAVSERKGQVDGIAGGSPARERQTDDPQEEHRKRAA